MLFGYILVWMDLIDDFWVVVCNMLGVMGFVGVIFCLLVFVFDDVVKFLFLWGLMRKVVKGVVSMVVVVEVGGLECLVVEVDYEVGELVIVMDGLFVILLVMISEVNVE